jgi:hypothetical protein
MLFREVIALYTEKLMKAINTKIQLLTVKAGGTYTGSCHSSSKG